MRKQFTEVVAKGTISAEGLLVKQALDTAGQADLVSAVILADGPTHAGMPAAAQHERRSPAQSCCTYTQP